MKMKSVGKLLCVAGAVALMGQSVAAEKVLKLGTVGFWACQSVMQSTKLWFQHLQKCLAAR